MAVAEPVVPSPLIGTPVASAAGPLTEGVPADLVEAPSVPWPRPRQILALSWRELAFVFRWHRELGDVFRVDGFVPGRPAITCQPEHVRSLFTASPALAPSLTAESALLPIVGPNSVLTANGPRHLRQRKLLLPPFHGEAIERYVAMITDVADREIDRWPLNQPVALAPLMQEITLDVIMAGILGVADRPAKGTPEYGLRRTINQLTRLSTTKLAKLGELMNLGHTEAVGVQKRAVDLLNRFTYPVIEARRRAGDLDERTDILSLILRAKTEDGEALSDHEVRDELLTIILAGFETTANSLAWTWERLVRNPGPHDALRHAVRTGEDADGHVERTIYEAMRSRPVIPAIGRRISVPWQLGPYRIEAGAPVVMSIALLHHREDLYPDPFSFRPERWVGHKPGTYEWIPFGGGTRRCLGAALAMAEQRTVLREMARRLEIEAVEQTAERVQHRNVTMIPSRGAQVVIRSRVA